MKSIKDVFPDVYREGYNDAIDAACKFLMARFDYVDDDYMREVIDNLKSFVKK